MSATAIQVSGVVKNYRRRRHAIEVLRGVDLLVQAGEWVTLRGASGCGKTTLLHVIGLLDRADAGSIAYFDREVSQLNGFRQAAVRRQEMGFVFQSYQLFPELSALENVMLPGRINHQRPGPCREHAIKLIRQVGMEHRIDHRPAELSGGEQQRLAIARALINRPRIIFADEPTGNLDARNAEELIKILRQLQADEGLTIVMVTHDRDLAAKADRTFILEGGKLRRG